MSPRAARGWRGFHLYYHADRDRVMAEVVAPLAAGLRADGLVRRFFAIRYPLGGPHVRLRVEVRAADAPAVAARVHAAAAEFFARHPSPEPLDPARIRGENRGIIGSDPFATEADDEVVPDNSVRAMPVHLEVNRYGGPERIRHSLDFFAVSTVEVLRFLRAHAGATPGRRTAGVMRMLARQAWGLAADADEFVALAGYGPGILKGRLGAVTGPADAAFDRARDATCALVRGELASLAGAGEPVLLAEAGRGLAHALRGTPARALRGICNSHLHMAANRLGLRNADEVYVSRMLQRAAQAIAESEPGFWRELWEAHAAWRAAPVRPLRAQAAAALDAFAAEHAPA